MRHRVALFSLPFVRLGPKEAVVGRIMSGRGVMAAGKAGLGLSEVGWRRGQCKMNVALCHVVFIAIRPFR
jgi:hypothetical protein